MMLTDTYPHDLHGILPYTLPDPYRVGLKVIVREKGINYAHDFLATKNWYIGQVTPFVSMSDETLTEILQGETSPGESMRYYPERPCQMVLIERYPKNGEPPRVHRMDTAPCHIYHYGTCHESADGKRFPIASFPISAETHSSLTLLSDPLEGSASMPSVLGPNSTWNGNINSGSPTQVRLPGC